MLAQETRFPFEILVGEDCSTDRTRLIVEDYQQRFPGRFRIFLHDGINKLRIGPLVTGRKNFVNNLRQARGEYVALLEGDDYWTDSSKLQRQVDALDRHRKCSLAFHNAEVVDETSGTRETFVALHGDQLLYPKDVLESWKVPTASILYRRKLLQSFPTWFYEVLSGDYALQLLLVDKGPFIYLDRMMSVYRKHEGGISRITKSIWFRRNLAHLYVRYNRETGRRYEHIIAPILAERFHETSLLSQIGNNNPFRCLQDLMRALHYRRLASSAAVKDVARDVLDWTYDATLGLTRKLLRRTSAPLFRCRRGKR